MLKMTKALLAGGVTYSRLVGALLLIILLLFLFVALFPNVTSVMVPALETYAESFIARWAGALVFSIPAVATLGVFLQQALTLYQEQRALNQIEQTVDRLTGSETLRMDEAFERSGLSGANENEREFLLSTSSGLLAKRVFNDVKALRFDPIGSIVDFQKGELLRWSTRIMSFQSIAVRGGILGTFFGLIAALTSVPDILSLGGQPTIDPANNVSDLIQSLSLAFGTSIAGLIAAILISLVASATRSEELKVLTQQERIAGLVQVLCKKNLSDDSGIAKTAKELQGHLNRNRDDLIATRNAMQDRTDDLRDAAEALAENTKGPADHIVGHVSELTRLLERLRITLHETAQLSSRVSDNEAKTLKGVVDLIQDVADDQNKHFEHLIDQQKLALKESTDKFTEKLSSMDNAMTQTVEKIVTNVSRLAESAVQDKARHSLEDQSRAFEKAAQTAFAEQRAMLTRHGLLLFVLYAAGLGGVVGLSLMPIKTNDVVSQPAEAVQTNTAPVETEIDDSAPNEQPEQLDEVEDDAGTSDILEKRNDP